jgi:hypothetical protein
MASTHPTGVGDFSDNQKVCREAVQFVENKHAAHVFGSDPQVPGVDDDLLTPALAGGETLEDVQNRTDGNSNSSTARVSDAAARELRDNFAAGGGEVIPVRAASQPRAARLATAIRELRESQEQGTKDLVAILQAQEEQRTKRAEDRARREEERTRLLSDSQQVFRMMATTQQAFLEEMRAMRQQMRETIQQQADLSAQVRISFDNNHIHRHSAPHD